MTVKQKARKQHRAWTPKSRDQIDIDFADMLNTKEYERIVIRDSFMAWVDPDIRKIVDCLVSDSWKKRRNNNITISEILYTLSRYDLPINEDIVVDYIHEMRNQAIGKIGRPRHQWYIWQRAQKEALLDNTRKISRKEREEFCRYACERLTEKYDSRMFFEEAFWYKICPVQKRKQVVSFFLKDMEVTVPDILSLIMDNSDPVVELDNIFLESYGDVLETLISQYEELDTKVNEAVQKLEGELNRPIRYAFIRLTDPCAQIYTCGSDYKSMRIPFNDLCSVDVYEAIKAFFSGK